MKKELKVDAPLGFGGGVEKDRIKRLEDAGFNGIYSADGPNDAFISLASVALLSEKIEFLTEIAVAFARNPMNVAYMSNDMQNLTKGRFTLGLGTQIKPHIERRFSMPWSKPAARMEEFVEAIKAIWKSWETGEKLAFEGEFYQHTLMNPVFAPEANQYGCPNIYIAGVGPKMTESAARVGDGFLCHPFNSQKSFDSLTLPALQRGRDEVGKSLDDFDVCYQLITAVGEDDKALQESIFSAKNQIAFYGTTPAYLPILEVHGWDGMHAKWKDMARNGQWQEMAASVTDEMLEAFAVVGNPAEVAEQIKQRCEGKADRVSPIIYNAELEPMFAILNYLRG